MIAAPADVGRAPTTPGPPPAEGRLLREAVRRGRAPAALVLVATALGAAAAVTLPLALGRAVDLLIARADAGFWVLLCTALIATEVATDALVARTGGRTGAATTAWLRRRALAGFLAAPPAATTGTGLPTRLTANALDAGTAPVAAATAAAAGLAPLGGLAGLFLVDPWAGAAFVCGVPLLLLILRALLRDGRAALTAYQEEQGRMARLLTGGLSGAATIAAAGTVRAEERRVLAPLAGMRAAGERTWRVQGRAAGLSGALMPLLVAAVLAVGGVRLVAGHLTPGDLLALSRYAVLAAGAGALAGALNGWVRAKAGTARLETVTTLPRTPYGTRDLPPHGDGTLTLRGVHVTRDGVPLLDSVTLSLPGGTTTAVVGRSGAGKSLLAAVAGRLTDPDEGTVHLDGTDLRTLSADALRHAVAYAFERPALFGATIADAVAVGPLPDANLRRALHRAAADTFTDRLPLGPRTPLPEAPLSGGELQRLGLARAFTRPARLLILDDATSSLDTVTAHLVDRTLTEAPGTRLTITHRLSVAARADQVVWLDGGRVRGIGPHAALRRDPAYRAVFGAGAGADADADASADSGTGTGTRMRTELPTDTRTDAPTEIRTDMPANVRTDMRADMRADMRTDPRVDSGTGAVE
ncbi:ATP-binding cassette domain-containing protein [Streptomyces koyangensis]|uniref:ABC transporter ATP-binding protein n=1 Tax=Streptomyces koyangensis TaxID=188770 RepID=A0A385DCW7_9ACTN|nr:ABC transporter ATP-binding protein [Streptomyces koyangensis]AXQ55507.1 ABC transporter ATP-binding protein [Streptomyces koyangensis]